MAPPPPLPPEHPSHTPEPPHRRFGIRSRLLVLLLPGIVALLALDSWNDYHSLADIIEDAYDQSLVEPVQALQNSLVLAEDGSVSVRQPFSVQAMFDSTRPRYKYLHVGVMPAASGAPPGTPATTLLGVPDLPPPPAQPAPQPDGDDAKPVFYDAVYDGHAVRIAALRLRLHGPASNAGREVLIQAAESTGPRAQALSTSFRRELLGDTRMVLVMVLLLWVGVAWTLHPLERLRRSLRARAPDDLKPLDPHGVPQEVVPLVDAVNHHIAGHRRMLAEHSQFLADASHQLRTPLGILSIQAAYAVRESDVDRMRESLHAIVAQLARTRRLSEQLLALAHATHEDKDGSPRAAPVVDLNAIARGVVLQYLPLARENEQDLGWVDARRDGAAPAGSAAVDDGDSDGDDGSDGDEEEGGPPLVPVAADAAEVHEILANLVHNAIKYTPRGGRITVSVRRDASHARAEVRDSGPGIEPARRASVFERFQREASGASAAGGHGAQGAGLGLTIARSYARRNGGDIELDNIVQADAENNHESNNQRDDARDGKRISGGGLRATLRLPLGR